MKKHILILKKATFGLLCISLLTTACKKKSDDPAPAPSDEVITLKQSKLSGANENPAVTTTASGTVEGSLNKTSNKLTYKISYSNLTPTGMHIHAGFAGVNGAVAIDLGTPTSSPAEATVLLTDAQEEDLLAGKLYVNIHTSGNAGGELRAQILTNDIVLYQNALSGANQVPAVTTTSTGTFYGTFNKSTKIMNYTFVYSGTTPNGAHIHDGLAGATGGVVFTLATPAAGTTSGTTLAFTDAQVANLEAGKMYVNVHTAANGNGEVRAQLANENVWVYNNITLSGANEVPAVTASSSGKAYVTYNALSSKLDYVLITNMLTANGAHLHAGAIGAAGAVLYTLTTPAAGAGDVTTTGTVNAVSATDAQTLKAGNTYINIHTATNASGELRGQVK
ncbi:MAG: CHRD domain-containing protein [Cytophagaceae bacterium]|nr:CHRD domain-containing protein [Cytophagaceae bacterium]